MKIVRLQIERFRTVRSATLYPGKHNAYLGPNNVGKTAILEALNLLLNPELGSRSTVIDENDFYLRQYRAGAAAPHAAALQPDAASQTAAPPQAVTAPSAVPAPQEVGAPPEPAPPQPVPVPPPGSVVPPHPSPTPQLVAPQPATPPLSPPAIRVEAVIADMTAEDIKEFGAVLVPWSPGKKEVVEQTNEGEDPFAAAVPAVRVCFEGWFDEVEDEFAWKTYFRTDPGLSKDESPPFNRQHKRYIGFLIYRDFRALQRPVTLESFTLFGRLLSSQDANPRNFEQVLDRMKGVLGGLFQDQDFARVVNEYRQELMRYMPLAHTGAGQLLFEVTDRTREQMKQVAQLYISDVLDLPLQKMGAGTRSLALLAVLLLIARKRGRGILALEEPETFLFPHAQRRVIDEALSVASQTFVTTHSPHVLERIPVDGFQRLSRSSDGGLSAEPVVLAAKDGKNLRDRFRKQLSEALLGRGCIVVEEESTRLWLLRASAVMHGREFDGAKREAIELLGVSVVAAQGNGDVPFVAGLLARAGLKTIAVLDRVKDGEAEQLFAKHPELSVIFHPETGLEDVLRRELPKAVLRDTLTSAPGARHAYPGAEVDAWLPDEFAEKAREFLRQHKGYLTIHEWMLERLGFETMPLTLKRAVALACDAVTTSAVGSCSILPR